MTRKLEELLNIESTEQIIESTPVDATPIPTIDLQDKLEELEEGWIYLNIVPENNRTYELCMEAIKNHGNALQFVEDQTDEICKLAVSQNPYALKYVRNQTDELCTLAVSKNPFALEYVINRTD